jgi:hypothetical protein
MQLLALHTRSGWSVVGASTARAVESARLMLPVSQSAAGDTIKSTHATTAPLASFAPGHSRPNTAVSVQQACTLRLARMSAQRANRITKPASPPQVPRNATDANQGVGQTLPRPGVMNAVRTRRRRTASALHARATLCRFKTQPSASSVLKVRLEKMGCVSASHGSTMHRPARWSALKETLDLTRLAGESGKIAQRTAALVQPVLDVKAVLRCCSAATKSSQAVRLGTSQLTFGWRFAVISMLFAGTVAI